VHPDAYKVDSDRHRVLLVGGLTGSPDDTDAVVSVLEAYATSRRLRNRIALSVIPCANPDGLDSGEGPDNGSGGNPAVGYPPEGGFFNHETDPEARYLWRYIGLMAPDYVLEVRSAAGTRWESSSAPQEIADALDGRPIKDDGGLLSALGSGCPNDLGRIPGIRLNTLVSEVSEQVGVLWNILDGESSAVEKSDARKALDSRRQRTPGEVASKLVDHYGDTLEPVIYTQGVAMSGRLRYGVLRDSIEQYAEGIATVVQPYLAGDRPWFGDSDGGANYAGIVWCDEMYEATEDSRYRDLLLSIADRFRGNETGHPPPPCDPDYRTEDMFFAGAILGRAYALTGEVSYLDIQTAFLMDAEIQLDSGLFKHCRSVPYHWGRGNGFAALGYAETLTYLPNEHDDRDDLISIHKRHLDALMAHQRPSGMFSQLLDLPGTYQELTSVCMVGYAIARGLRMGWLDESYCEFVDSLWNAASERIGLDGEVVDGCTGTGAVNDRRFYIDRAAEYGRDDRTGNLALWFAVEMERLRRRE
jgi:rhamnogalacturonyl hydrolase YesR